MKAVHLQNQSLQSLAWPMIVSVGFGIALPVMDSWFLAQVSDDAAAGVGALGPVIFTVFTALQMLLQAGASISSQFHGAGRLGHMRATWNLMLAGGLALGGISALIVWVLRDSMGQWMGLQGAAFAASVQYLEILAPAVVFKSMQVALSVLVNSYGMARWNLWANVAAVVCNGILDPMLIFGWFGLPKMGVQGVAIATVISWMLMVAILWFGAHQGMNMRARWIDLRRGWGVVLPDWLRMGLPAAVEPVSFQLHQVAMTAMAVRIGHDSMAARVYAGSLVLLPVVVSLGIGLAAPVLIAHAIGGKQWDRANLVLRKSLAWASGLAFAIGALVYLAGVPLLRSFTKDAEIVSLGMGILLVDMFLQPAKAANIVLTNALRAAGDSRFPAVVGSAMMWSIGIGVAVGMAFGLETGVQGLWIGMCVDEWTRAGVNWRRWNSGVWKSKGVVA